MFYLLKADHTLFRPVGLDSNLNPIHRIVMAQTVANDSNLGFMV